MDITCISDLHGYYPKLEGGDLLIVAGDLTARDSSKEFYEFADWMRNQEYEEKIVIAGNHDTWLTQIDNRELENWTDIGEFEYLLDSGTECDFGTEEVIFKVWGSPWSLWFDGINPKCKAFTGSEKDLAKKFALIPYDVDILVTHSPPCGILDEIKPKIMPPRIGMLNVGSTALRNMILSDEFINLKLHVFGHIHEQGGKELKTTLTTFVNASHVNERYEPVNKPVRVVL